jgi:hypothetical protein
VKRYPLVQKEIDVTKDEIHYENERYQGEREEERADVVADDIALEGHRFVPYDRQTRGNPSLY